MFQVAFKKLKKWLCNQINENDTNNNKSWMELFYQIKLHDKVCLYFAMAPL